MSGNIAFCRTILLAVIFTAAPVFGGPIPGTPDPSCNPSVDPPSGGGCVWYNFYAFASDGSIHAGDSFTNYYVAAPDPAWSITTSGPTFFRVLDGGHQGDVFSVYDNSILIGTTSATAIDANHACGSNEAQATNPAACWNDPLMSRGTFLLAAGSHSLTVTWDQRVPGGNSTLQWFQIGVAPSSTVPEPTTMLLLGSGLLLLGVRAYLRRPSRD